MRFVKYNVCCSAFAVLEDDAAERSVRSICDRYTGVGTSGAVIVRQNPFGARIFRADGREIPFDASSLACAAAYLCEKCGTPKISMITGGEICEAEILPTGEVCISLPKIKAESLRFRRADVSRPIEYVKLSVGAAMRAVCPVDDIYGAILFGQGEALSKYLSGALAYDVDLARLRNDGLLEVRSYERGSGYVASALGAYAAAYVLNALGKCGGDVRVKTDSGKMTVSLAKKPTAKMTVSKILSGEIY